RAKRTAPPSGRGLPPTLRYQASLPRPLRTVPCPGPLPGSQRVRLTSPRPRIHPHPVTPGVPRTQLTATERLPRAAHYPARPHRASLPLPRVQSAPHTVPQRAPAARRRPLQTAAARILDAFDGCSSPENAPCEPKRGGVAPVRGTPSLQPVLEKTQTSCARLRSPLRSSSNRHSNSPPPASSTRHRLHPLMCQVEFELARAALKQLKGPVSDPEKLLIYGLYKQATQGDCGIPTPPASDVKARAKWEAWSANKGVSKMDAMRSYAAKVEELKKKEVGGREREQRGVQDGRREELGGQSEELKKEVGGMEREQREGGKKEEAG
uniref:Diazepam-binding inhibitor-like 5 n=1 Tax=Macaca fascicularis TaxID=9541 RepID=A0A7N9D9L9_MACFA